MESLILKLTVHIAEVSSRCQFAHSLIKKLKCLLKETVPDLEMIHYQTDSPTNWHMNKTIFNNVRHHEKFIGYEVSWVYMKAGHKKGSCNSIEGNNE